MGEGGWDEALNVPLAMRALDIHHVELRVSDYRRSVRFYDGILLPLGFTRSRVRGERVTYYIRKATSIGIRPVKPRGLKRIAYSHRRAGLHHLAIAVRRRVDVDAAHRLLRRRRVRVLRPPQEYPRYAPGYYAVYFLDPDGIELEFVYWPER